MASLDEAMKGVRESEGGWVQDADDPGGETYVGISRRYHPNWKGWAFIDSSKINRIPDESKLIKDTLLIELVDYFYRYFFWKRFRGDEINDKLQCLANALMISAIHCGVRQAVKFLQESLNILNKNETIYDDLTVDGEMGNNTLSTFNRFATILQKDILVLHWIFQINYGAYLIQQMKSSPVKEKYARGWITRVMGKSSKN